MRMCDPREQQGPGRTAGSRTQGLAGRKDGASRILFGWSPPVVTLTSLPAKTARSQGKYLYIWWPYRDSNPSLGYDHTLAEVPYRLATEATNWCELALRGIRKCPMGDTRGCEF